MTTNGLEIQNLDFTDIQQQARLFLESQEQFKDYNFEASGLDILVKLFSFFNYQTNVVGNILVSENFLSTMLRRASVVSRAKELSYIPSSAKCATMMVDIQINERSGSTLPNQMILPKGSMFDSLNEKNEAISFVTKESYNINKIGTAFYLENIKLYQGDYQTTDFIRDYKIKNQRFILQQKNIDSTTLEVFVQEGNDISKLIKYELASSILEIDSSSKVFFIQEGPDEKIEIYFGDGILGKKIENGKIIKTTYITTLGEAGNDYSEIRFRRTPNINIINDGNFVVTPQGKSIGGTNIESIESIKFNAPLSYLSQDRLLSKEDYINFISKKFSYIKSVNAWFGNKQYGIPGKVYIAIATTFNEPLSDLQKQEIIKSIEPYKVGVLDIVIIDSNYIEIVTDTLIYVSSLINNANLDEIENAALFAINEYSDVSLERFNKDFEHSILSKKINDSHSFISNNDTTYIVKINIKPTQNIPTSLKEILNNEIIPNTLTSNTFIESNISGKLIDENGIIYFVNLSGEKIKELGTIDYLTGSFSISNILVSSNNTIITMSLKPKNLSFFASSEKLLKISSATVKAIFK